MHCTPLRTGMAAFLVWAGSGASIARGATVKQASTLYPDRVLQTVRDNCRHLEQGREVRRRIVTSAEPFRKMSDDQLWSLMFGPTIRRSWMVWSNGFCPACKKSVPMYNWEIDAVRRPWKVRCPHCKEVFPKNDFEAFYRSGLDEHGVFDPARADRSLLFNLEHPDPADPLHLFGVDDGEGYVEGDKRWRFIGAYLIYGQWKQAVLGGAKKLADAFVVTGDRVYAHKAGILLDRIADLYPTFDFKSQGIIYDKPSRSAGYVSVWHDACEEVRELALAYDAVFDGIKNDPSLVQFLADKARKYRLDNPKATFADIQRNIEERIFRETIAHRDKIHSNYPSDDIAVAVMHLVLATPEDRAAAEALTDTILTKATAVDGVTGEKGLAGYATIGPRKIARFLARRTRTEADLLARLLDRHPSLHACYRFHIDTLCLDAYYPLSGDAGAIGRQTGGYVGVSFGPAGLEPSMYTFLYQLYLLTGDPAFAQVIYRANGNSVEGLPHDLFVQDAAVVQKAVSEVVAREGASIKLGSINKQQWHMAILRSGKGAHRRALWLDYDAGQNYHGHADGMNLGLFAKGLDLLADFGYPPVQYGGWDAPRARWYRMTASHNTVVVDGKSQSRTAAGKTTLWADGRQFRAIRASGPAMYGVSRYERTAVMIDLSEDAFYVLDVFRIVGGQDHAKFTHTQFATITTKGLALRPADDYGYETQMRHFQCDPAPSPGWSVDFKMTDPYGYLPAGSDVHVRYTDLTRGAEASTCEAWVVAGKFDSVREMWIPRVMTRRRGNSAPLVSTFVGVLEPYEQKSNLSSIRRVSLTTETGEPLNNSHVAVVIDLADGRRDLLLATDAGDPLKRMSTRAQGALIVQPDSDVACDAELALVRKGVDGRVTHIALAHGSRLHCGPLELRLAEPTNLIEIELSDHGATVVAGETDRLLELTLDGRNAWRRQPDAQN